MPGPARSRVGGWPSGGTRGHKRYPLYLSLPGASGDYASSPDAAGIDLVGDVSLVAYVALDDWTPSAQTALVAKWDATGNQRSYMLAVETDGTLSMNWSVLGTVVVSKVSTAAPVVSNAAWLWVRASLDVDNDAVGNDVFFYTSPDGVVWTQLGDTVTTALTTAILSGTAILEVGSSDTGAATLATGKIGIAKVYSDKTASTLVASFDPDLKAKRGDTSFTATTGEAWTINGAALIS